MHKLFIELMDEVLVEIGKTRYRSVVEAGTHRVIADEPAALGGGDEGMDPVAMLLGSLGSCTAITLRMYADRKGWPLEGVKIRLTLHRHKSPESTRILTRLWLQGPLDGPQRTRLLEIAGRCPVHRILSHPVTVETQLAQETGEKP